MKNIIYFTVIFIAVILTNIPSYALELGNIRKDVSLSIKKDKLKDPCNIYDIVKNKDLELMKICFSVPLQQEKLAAYYLRRYEIMYNIITENKFKKDAEQALSFLLYNVNWNPNLMIDTGSIIQTIYLIGKQNHFWIIPNDTTVKYNAAIYNNMPLMLRAALANNISALDLIYNYNTQYESKEYSNYVVIFSLIKFIRYYDTSKYYKAFEILYNFAKSKGIISTDINNPNTIKLISEILKPGNRGRKNKSINLIVDDYKNGNEMKLIKGLIKYTEYDFDFSYFFTNIINLNEFSIDEKIDILNYTITNRSYDVNTINTILEFLTTDDIKNNFDAKILFNLQEKLLIEYLNTSFIKFVNYQANNLRVRNDNIEHDINSISLFAYWVLTYSRTEQTPYIEVAKLLLNNGASVAEKVNGKTLNDFILEHGSENLKKELNL